MNNFFSLQGQKILITGASDGIGKSTSILLSRFGAKLILVGRNPEKLISVQQMLEGEGHSLHSYDLRDIEGIEPFVKTLVEQHGPLDGFVHCAGISGLRPLKMTYYSYLHDMMLVNFYSFVELVRSLTLKGNFHKNMSIVSMSSAASLRGEKSKTAYSASKAAMDGAIRSMAKELADKSIRINSIVAGFVNTDMFERYKQKSGIDESNEAFSKYALGLIQPDEIAQLIAFLLSEHAAHITGSGMVVDSGATS